MARLSEQDFVRITLQVGSIRSVAPNQPASQSPEAGGIFGELGPGLLEQGKWQKFFWPLCQV